MDVAWKFSEWGTVCYNLSKTLEDVVWIGPYMAQPFYFMYEKCYWAAHHISLADDRIESLGWDEFIWSPGAWLLVRLGADIAYAEYYKYRPWDWLIWKFRKEHPILDALLAWDLSWIGNYIWGNWPVLWDLTYDPAGWIWGKIKERWWWVDEIIYYPGRWLLTTAGADIAYAEYYRDRPWEWFFWKFRKEHPVIDALLDRDTLWLWAWVTEAIDTYLDTHIDWLVNTAARVLSLIWQARLP